MLGTVTPYYSHAGITIYHADCRDVLHICIGRVQAALVDPPYGVSGALNSKTAARGTRKNEYTQFTDSPEYVESVAAPVVLRLVNAGLRVIVTPGNRCLTSYPRPDSFGAAYQPASVGLQAWGRADAQPILYYGRSPHGGVALPSQPCSHVLTESPPADARGHPCPKPLSFWSKLLLSCSMPGETVLDPFVGSGTTLLAAKNLGRNAIGIEIEERWCEIAATRLSQEVLAL